MKHLCHGCKHRFSSLFLTQVSLAGGEYTIWNETRAAHYRRQHQRFPRRVWLCMTCYGHASQSPIKQRTVRRARSPEARP